MVSGAWVDPRAAKITVGEWCRTWLTGYGTRKPRTVRQAEVHIAKITEAFGARRLDSIRPSEVKSWTAALHAEGLADSYIYASHARLAQVLSDAVHDGVLTRSPVSRRTSPKAGKQRPYLASTEDIWELHDAMGERYRPGLLLAAFAGLRLAEVCGLRVTDVDFMRASSTRCCSTRPTRSRPRSHEPPSRSRRAWRSPCRPTSPHTRPAAGC